MFHIPHFKASRSVIGTELRAVRLYGVDSIHCFMTVGDSILIAISHKMRYSILFGAGALGTALCSTFKISQVPSTNPRLRGPAALARSYSKHGVPISERLAEAASQTGNSSAVSVDGDNEYATPITIGGQKFNMEFDTGSSDL